VVRFDLCTAWLSPLPVPLPEGSELGDLECGREQVENNRARSAGSSYRFGNLSWEGYREAFQASFPPTFFPRAVPWAVIVLHLRRATP